MATRRSNSRGGPVRFAVVGLGHIARSAVLPAFARAKRECELVALVSNDEAKSRKLARRYSVERTYDYSRYEECLNRGEVDAVYLALPNDLHAEYTIRAARAGVHVLCEKPMAATATECRAMIAACSAADVRLMIAHRSSFGSAHEAAAELVRCGQLGEPRFFGATFTKQVEDHQEIRRQHERGGSVLSDVGIDCINAARTLFASEPLEVAGWAAALDQERFDEVHEMVSVVMLFPQSRLATFTASFGASHVSHYRIVGTRGDLVVEPAFGCSIAHKHRLTTSWGVQSRSFAKADPFADELLHFASCVRSGRDPEPAGDEGLAGVEILEAIGESIRTGKSVALEAARSRVSVRVLVNAGARQEPHRAQPRRNA